MTKLTDLTALTETPAPDDVLVVVDVSDTTQAASGTTKAVEWSALAPRVRVFASASQPTSNATQTSLTFDTETFDTDTMHDTGTNPERITFTTAGVYLVGGHNSWASSSAGRRQLRILLNSATQLTNVVQDVDTGTGHVLSVVTIFDMAAGDFVELQAFQNTGGDLNAPAATFWAVQVGAAT